MRMRVANQINGVHQYANQGLFLRLFSLLNCLPTNRHSKAKKPNRQKEEESKRIC